MSFGVQGGEAMYGEVFEVGDRVVWRESNTHALGEEGPFFVNIVINNDDPQACACGASRHNGYVHDEREQCRELPAQMIALRREDGSLLLDSRGQLASYSSYWFRRF